MDRGEQVLGLSAFAAGLSLAFSWSYVPPKVWQPVESGGAFAAINRPTAGPRTKAPLPRGKHALQLHSLGTPNGVKVTALLEELAGGAVRLAVHAEDAIAGNILLDELSKGLR